MTCETLQETIDGGSLSEIAAFDAHLQTCPSCAARAANARESQQVLTQFLDDFSAAEEPHWQSAMTQVAPVRSRSRVQDAAVLLAMAAALVLAVWTQLPPSTVGSAVETHAVELSEAFERIRTDDLHALGLSRSEEDDLHRTRMTEKSLALEEAEQAWGILAADPDPKVAIAGLKGLALLYGSMGDALRDFDRPSYLSAEQSDLYGGTLDQKAETQWQRSLDVLDEAMELAEEGGFSQEVAAIEVLIDEVVRALDDEESEVHEREDAATGELEMLGYIE